MTSYELVFLFFCFVLLFDLLLLFVCLFMCSYGPGEEDAGVGSISSENKPRIVLMGLRR